MQSLILTSYRRPVLFSIIFLIILAITLFLATRLKIDADLNALLPDSFASVQDLDKVKKRFGGIGYIVITASGDAPSSLSKFAQDATNSIKDLSDVNFIDYKRPSQFFKDRGFYFLESEDLNIIEKRLKKRWRWERRKQNPMYIDLEESEPPSLDFQDIESKYEDKRSKWMQAQQSDSPYYFNQDKSLIAIFIKPNMASFNLEFSRNLINKIQERLDTLDYSQYDTGLKVELTGRYQKKIDLQDNMQVDLKNASVLAFGLIVTYLLIHFRRIEAIALVLFPLTLGILMTFAFTQLVFQQLNILTAFIGVILIGLGIDHGIHLLSRFKDERQLSGNDELAIQNTFLQTGRAVVIASLTTFVTFASLSLSEFRAFYEFGVIASAGMIFIAASYLLFLPALLSFVTRFSWQLQSKTEVKLSHNSITQLILSNPKQHLIAGVVIWILLAFFIARVEFNYDFESLGNSDLRSFQLDKQVNTILGYSQTPMIALTDNKDDESFVATKLHENKILLGEESGLDFVLATSDLIPDNQIEKQVIIEKIGKIINRMKASWFEEADVKHLEMLKRMVATTPFSYEDLPEELKKLFGAGKNNAPADGIIMLFPGISLSDGDRVLQLSEEIKNVQQEDGTRLVVAGESMVLADILRLVFAELPMVLFLSLMFIILVLWYFIKDWKLSLICLTPAIMTLSITLGIMALLGLELNYINVLMLPVLLGLSVDSGVHIVTRSLENSHLSTIIRQTGFAIWGSIFTSALGIGAMLITNHHGLNSLAQVGTIGLLVNLIVSVFILPALLSVTYHRNEKFKPV